MVGLTKTVAREWGAFNIRCNAIAYGFIATRLTASKDDGASISVNGEKVTHLKASQSLDGGTDFMSKSLPMSPQVSDGWLTWKAGCFNFCILQLAAKYVA